MDRTDVMLEVMGRPVHELRGGEGSPLLYLHSAMGETDMWPPHLIELTEKWEIHAPTHPGFGRSEGLETIRDIEDLVFHYLAYMDQMGWKSVDMVGFSLGGWIAAEIAARHPSRVSRLVLVSSVGIWIRQRPIHDIFIEDLRYPDRFISRYFHDTDCPAAQVLKAMMGSLDLPDEYIIRMIRSRAATAKIGWNPLLHDPRLAGLLPRVTAPTLCLWGDDDKVVPEVYGERFAELIPGAELRIVPECGHLLPLEKQAEFVAAVTEFMAG